jgi:cysteine-rich repeat protein
MQASRTLPAVLIFLAGCIVGDGTDPSLFMTTSLGPLGPSAGESGEEGDAEGDAVCGDGLVDVGEECDLGPENADSNQCTTSCRIATCGDGLVFDGFEECDDGNLDNTDDCIDVCVAAVCGDGYVHEGAELCDDGNLDGTDGCTAVCKPGTCGDGILQDNEQCDDGNSNTDDYCPACQLAFCGDGFEQAGVEACDDGNFESNDACTSPACELGSCGDGILWDGVEECDDGNEVDGDDCTLACTVAYCGDGVKHDGVEACDDGNDVNNDLCTNTCASLLWFVSGPQINVPVEQLSGWDLCWSGTYSTQAASLTNTVLGQKCTGSKLLEGCRQIGANVFTVVAMGERADVLFDVGNQNAGKHEANGVAWYYSNSYSMGFARAGDAVTRNSCDTANVNPQDRLCWHTGGDALNGGYRCGSTTSLNSNATWQRLIYQAD